SGIQAQAAPVEVDRQLAPLRLLRPRGEYAIHWIFALSPSVTAFASGCGSPSDDGTPRCRHSAWAHAAHRRVRLRRDRAGSRWCSARSAVFVRVRAITTAEHHTYYVAIKHY